VRAEAEGTDASTSAPAAADAAAAPVLTFKPIGVLPWPKDTETFKEAFAFGGPLPEVRPPGRLPPAGNARSRAPPSAHRQEKPREAPPLPRAARAMPRPARQPTPAPIHPSLSPTHTPLDSA
jgi:hypothetical protein